MSVNSGTADVTNQNQNHPDDSLAGWQAPRASWHYYLSYNHFPTVKRAPVYRCLATSADDVPSIKCHIFEPVQGR